MQKIDPKKLSLPERVEKLNDMILHGYILEAFEKFYAENIIKKENENQPTVGKNACRKIQEDLVTSIIDFRSAVVKNVIISDNITVVEWEFDYTHKDWGVRKHIQVVVQRWNNEGEIINETIYNNN